MKWKSVGNRVIVKKIHEDNVTASGIVLSETLANELDKVGKAEVISVGSGRKPDGTIEPIQVEVGDIIMYHKHYGTDLSGMIPTEDDKDLMSLMADDIIGVVTG